MHVAGLLLQGKKLSWQPLVLTKLEHPVASQQTLRGRDTLLLVAAWADSDRTAACVAQATAARVFADVLQSAVEHLAVVLRVVGRCRANLQDKHDHRGNIPRQRTRVAFLTCREASTTLGLIKVTLMPWVNITQVAITSMVMGTLV